MFETVDLVKSSMVIRFEAHSAHSPVGLGWIRKSEQMLSRCGSKIGRWMHTFPSPGPAGESARLMRTLMRWCSLT